MLRTSVILISKGFEIPRLPFRSASNWKFQLCWNARRFPLRNAGRSVISPVRPVRDDGPSLSCELCEESPLGGGAICSRRWNLSTQRALVVGGIPRRESRPGLVSSDILLMDACYAGLCQALVSCQSLAQYRGGSRIYGRTSS